MRERTRGVVYAISATAFFSTGAVLVRLAEGISPVEIASLRMLLGAWFIWLLSLLRREKVRIQPRVLKRLLPIGGAAALHFLTFIASLFYTTIAHALTLTYTAPIFISLLAKVLLSEPLGTRRYLGIGLSIVGTTILTGFEAASSPTMLLGDGLALLAAVAFAFYSVLGRKERASVPLLVYAFWIYLLAGLLLAPFAIPTLNSSYTSQGLLAVLLLALFPSAFGHTLYNAALRLTHPTLVNIVAMQEVSGGILLGWLLLHEAPRANALVGAAVTLSGVLLVLL